MCHLTKPHLFSISISASASDGHVVRSIDVQSKNDAASSKDIGQGKQDHTIPFKVGALPIKDESAKCQLEVEVECHGHEFVEYVCLQ